MDVAELNRKRHRVNRWMGSLAAVGLVAVTSWGCAPRGAHPEVVAARVDYLRAQSDPSVRQSATVQLHEADRILRQAEEMWEQGGNRNEVGHLASLARSQVQVAHSLATYEQARLEIETQREVEARTRRLAAEQREIKTEPTVHSPGSWTSPLDVRVHSAFDGTVGGTVTNRSPHPVAEVVLMVNHQWLWRNEFRPGDDSPGRTEYLRIPEPIPPGGSVTFTHKPLVPLPTRDDGRFETSLEVVAFDEIRR